MPGLVLLLLANGAVPRAALFDEAPRLSATARPEPLRGVVEYAGALAAFTLANGAALALLDGATVKVSKSQVDLNGSEPRIGAAAGLVLLSPLAAAITSWAIGRGSSDWRPSLGWATAGAYGSSLIAVGAGLGLAYAGVDRSAAQAANVALYLAVPLGTVLLQNATKEAVR